MNNSEKSLLQIIHALKKYGSGISTSATEIRIEIMPERLTDNILPLLYSLLNNFERSYFIVINGLPFCLMPDATSHILYTQKKGLEYLKDNACGSCKYGKACPGWPKALKIQGRFRPRTVPELPREIVIEITSRCNLDCLLCFKEKDLAQVPLARIKRIIDDCIKEGIKTIRFTGGEPLLHPDIQSVLLYAKNKGLYVILNTNLTTLNNKIKNTLKSCVDNILIPLQGFDAQSECRLTGSAKNPFKEKLKNILAIKSLIPTLRLGTIISVTLVDNFDRYYYLIKRLGIVNWEMFRPMIAKGTAEFRTGADDILAIMQRVGDVKRDIGEVKVANAVPFCITEDLALSRYVLLGADADDGHSRIVFDSRGFFKPSYPITKNLGHDIKGAWLSPFLKRVRSLSYLPAVCKSCNCLKWCKGGSRFLAKVKYGSYFKRDPLIRNG